MPSKLCSLSECIADVGHPNRPNDQMTRLLKSLGKDWIFLGSGRSADLIFSHQKISDSMSLFR